MMLTIHGLPPHVKFQELKALVRQECNITDFILDNLVIDDDGCKKVRIGVTDDSDGSHLMKCLNGFRLTGHVLRVVPVGKPGPPNQEYDSRGYQHRNEFSTQANSYGNRLLDNQLGRGSSWTPNAQWSPNQPPLLQPQPNTFNQPQSGPLNTPFPAMPQARGQFAPGRGPHQSQGFGYPPKNNLQDHPVILGKDQFQGSNQYNVGHTPAFQGQDQIFQGAHGQPVQWNMQKQPLFDKQTPGYNQGGYKDQIPIKPGMEPMRKGLNDYKDQDRSDRYMSSRPMSPGRRVSPRGRLSPSGRRMSPSGRRISPHSAGPHGRIMTPHGFHDRRMSPSGRKDSPRVDLGLPGRGASPGRRLSPSGPQGRRMSPESFRHRVEPESILPGRRISPSVVPGRRMSPGFAGKRVSPPRRMSPSERRIPSRHSPGRRGSPRRMSPAKRASPGRRGSPRGSRFSPQSFKHDSTEGRQANMKQVRPAYDSSETAPNQPMYSGGYRQNMHQNVQYPVSGARPEHRPWQQDRDNTTMPPSKNMEKFDVPRVSDRTRVGDREEPKRSRSRSPVRRDRSPIKDRYKRHSPSPRSPRRSWALEKRQSPEIHEAPPPPIWPSQNSRDCDYSKQNRPIYSERVDNSNQKHVPTWDLPPFEEKTDNSGNQKRPSDDRFTQNNPISVHQDLQKWKSNLEAGNQKSPTRNPWDRQDQGFSERLRESLNFTPREEFARSGGDQRMQYSDNQDLRLRKHTLRQDHQDESRLKDDLPRRRDDFSRRYEDNREVFRSTELSKETGDVYKRIGEYGQKTQEYRKKDSRFDDQHMDDRFIQSTRDEEMNQHSRDDRKDYRYGTRFEPREQVKQREPEWITALKVKQATMQLNPGVKAKRDKAVEEIARRIMNKFEHELSNEIKGRVRDELILSISRILFDMFKKEDVSYIEIIIKFNAKFDHADEEKIFEEVMSSFPSHYRNKKRAAQGSSQVPAKTAKLDPKLVPGGPKGTEYQTPRAIVRNRNVIGVPDSAQPQKTYVRQQQFQAGPQKPRPKLVAGRSQVNNINVPAVTANVAATETKTSNQKPTVTQNIKTERTTESAALIKPSHETKSNLQSQEIHTNIVKDSRDCPMKYVEKQTRPVFSTGEIHELDPLLSRVLDDEVKNIMIKMWQELPDEASSDLDRYCLDVMRNEIGDSFSRVLGLNVIKRLLNVHNALFVKIRFSCKPNMEALKNFLRKYKIDKFKRIDPTSSIFAAQMNTFEDFDKLCSMKQFQCGEAKVWVTPCYRFTHCPDKIRSLYYEKYFNNKYINKTVPTKVTSGTQSGSEANDSENNKLKVVIKQEPVIEKKVQKVEEKKQDKIEQKDDKIEKKTATVIKKSENKELIKFTENKQLVNKKTGNPQQKTENTQQKIENKVEKLENKQQKVQVQNIVSKITRTIEKQENTEPKQLVKNVNKDSKKSSLVSNLHKENKTNVSATVNVNKKVPKIDIHVYDVLDEIVDEEIPENALEGEEELADEDILALMSEGVVLDECSGSDDE